VTGAPARTVDSAARVGVIGSGIAGASTAFALASRGVAVTIVDEALAGQATAASAGIIAPWVSTSTSADCETYAAGGNFYPAFLERLTALGIPDLGYRRSGALVVTTARRPSPRRQRPSVLARDRRDSRGRDPQPRCCGAAPSLPLVLGGRNRLRLRQLDHHDRPAGHRR